MVLLQLVLLVLHMKFFFLYFICRYGNPHSRTHEYGWEAESAVEEAREQVANLIGASDREIVFTSGATECNNLSLKGVARFYKKKKKHIITTQTVRACHILIRYSNGFI